MVPTECRYYSYIGTSILKGGFLSTYGWIKPDMFLAGFIHRTFFMGLSTQLALLVKIYLLVLVRHGTDTLLVTVIDLYFVAYRYFI